jgi:hypothetical protein
MSRKVSRRAAQEQASAAQHNMMVLPKAPKSKPPFLNVDEIDTAAEQDPLAEDKTPVNIYDLDRPAASETDTLFDPKPAATSSKDAAFARLAPVPRDQIDQSTDDFLESLPIVIREKLLSRGYKAITPLLAASGKDLCKPTGMFDDKELAIVNLRLTKLGLDPLSPKASGGRAASPETAGTPRQRRAAQMRKIRRG